jgi:hypothetical protein
VYASYKGFERRSKLAEMFRDPDDGLLARFCWAWPEPLPFKLGRQAPRTAVAIEALDKLRLLQMAPGAGGEPPSPVMVPLDAEAQGMIEVFGQDMQERQAHAAGLLRSAYGKARGLVLWLSLVLAMLRWCAKPVTPPEPAAIGAEAMRAACNLVADYFMPMAERVFGDAAAPQAERDAATLARWIQHTRPQEMHVRELQRKIRLPGLRTAEAIHAAARVLIEADWLRAPVRVAVSKAARKLPTRSIQRCWRRLVGSWSASYYRRQPARDTVDSIDTVAPKTGSPRHCVNRVNSVTVSKGAEEAIEAAERAAIQAEPLLPYTGTPERDRLEQAHSEVVTGLLRAAAHRPRPAFP